ncbi:MDR family MFS transporter [Cohnella yongneupensis]|uniref:MDR family MFS transporter n=1 Tax=Cohnella yongneupensis TaxID=425006 RepID=A0ABW0QW85_9BACL
MRIKDWDNNLKLRLGGEFAYNLIFWAFFPFLSIYFAASFGKGWAGILLMLSQSLSVVANLLGGYCSDRFGRKRMMVLAAAGQAIGYGLFAFSSLPSVSLPLAGFFGFTLASFCGALYWPASQAMVADVVPEEHRSGVFAVFYTSANIAVVFGPLIGSLTYSNNLSPTLFAACALCTLLFVVLGRSLKETLPVSVAGRFKADAGQPWYSFLSAQLRDYRVIATDRVFLLFIIAGVLLSQTFMQLDLLLPVFINETVHTTNLFAFGDWDLTVTSQQLFGIIVSENGLFVALFTVVVTKWMLAYRDRVVFVSGALFYALGIALFGHMSTFWGFTIAVVVFTLAELISAGPQMTFVSRLAPEHMRGQYFAASSLRFTLGRTIAPLAIPLSSAIGFEWTFWLLTAIAVLSAVLYYVMFNVYEKK